jgi:hypothetical protein
MSLSPVAILYDNSGLHPVDVIADGYDDGYIYRLAVDANVTESALPVGAATEETLVAIKTKTDNIDIALSTRLNTLGQKTSANSAPIVIASDQSVIPVSDNGGSLTVDGTITAIQGSANTAANAWPLKITDGTNVASVSGAGALKTDGSSVTQPVSGTITANAGTNLNTSALALESGGNLAATATSLSVIDDWDEGDRAKVNAIVGQAGVQGGSGTVSSNTQRVVLATDVALPAGANTIGKLASNDGIDIGDVTINNGAGASAVNIQDGGNTITVDGVVTANIGTTNGIALDATLTGGAQKAISRGGAKGSTPAADITSTSEGDDHQALDIQIYHGGSAINPTSIRALTSSDVVTAAQGTANSVANAWPLKITDGTNTASVTASSALKVDASATTQPISAAALPLPSGAATESTLSSRLAEATFTTRVNTLGQKTMANSMPVTIASDQTSALGKTASAVSSANSSSVALAANATFSGAFEDVLGYANITISVYASHASATAGLKIEWSHDGITAVGDADTFTIGADTAKHYSFGVPTRYVKISFVNGGTQQTSFKLQTIYHVFAGKSSSHRIADSIVDNDDAEVVKAVLAGASVGEYKNVLVTTDGRLLVSADVIPPPNTTAVHQSVTSSISATTDTVYVIPNAANLRIQRFAGGGEIDSTAGSKIELFWDPNGNGTGMTLIRSGYVSGNNFDYSFDYAAPLVGDGTRSIRTRRSRFSGSAKEIAAFWDGYY